MTKVTYVPGDDEPATTTWNRVQFRANVPVDLSDDPTGPNSYEVEESVRVTADDGSYKLVPKKRRITMVELARGNASFHVGDDPAPAEPKGKAGWPKGRPRKPHGVADVELDPELRSMKGWEA